MFGLTVDFQEHNRVSKLSAFGGSRISSCLYTASSSPDFYCSKMLIKDKFCVSIEVERKGGNVSRFIRGCS
jgi:hypothetical protein